MRASTILALAATVLVLVGTTVRPAAADWFENPDGYGLYSPAGPKRNSYRYDPRSWYYRQPGYYPYYASNYWVPRADMRYRYRYQYYGPRYRYYPAWGYPRHGYSDDGCCHWGWLHRLVD